MEYNERTQELVAQQNDSLGTIQEIIKAFFLDEELTKDQIDFLNTNYKPIQDFLDSSINSPQDAETKKIFAKVILLAKQKGILPESLEQLVPTPSPSETPQQRIERIEETAETIAETVDEGVDKIKVGYKVGVEEISAQKAFEHYVDKAAVRITKVADKLVEKGFDWVVNKGARIVETAFPKLIPVVEVAKRVLVAAETPVRNIVKTGIKGVASFVKKSVNVGKAVVNTCKKVWGGVKSVGAKIRSWLPW